jgi:hypothetical protein
MDNIYLNTHYTRSIHLERDANSKDILSVYIPTTRALQTLADIADTLNTESMPRAWSLIGAYGSGKSSFASFLVQLFSRENHELAKQQLKNHPIPEIKNGYCAVLLTGSPESLSKRLVHALYLGAKQYFSSHSIVATLEQATQKHQDTSQIIALLRQLQQAVIEQQGQGILIIIDELGKFLEYEARHHSANDIFLLQAIAELAYQGSTANILLVVLMHQAFEHYAKGLSERLKNEWLKIQGRFQHISFLESAEQTLRVMSAAFSNQLSDTEKQQIKENTQKIVQTLAEQNAFYSGLSVETATDILANCYPLHPIAALILPVLCQKVAQNERTLFSYLGSSEQYGFKDSLSLVQFGDFVQPWQIFQYFIENQPLATTDHLTHRRWAEVITAMDRLGNSDTIETQLLKTIGLFNIMGSQSGFKASIELLNCCFQDLSALKQLEQKSIITYRKYNSEYRIWQGSDFDISLALQETKQQARFNLAEILEKRNKLPPILARKYSIQNNMIRYFQPHYANAETNINSFDKYQAKLIFFLAETDQDKEKFETIKTQGDSLTLYLLCDNADQLRNIISDAIALETIQNERPEVKADPVAQTELKAYLQDIQRQEKELLNDYLENPKNYDWYYQSGQSLINNKRHLQNKLSEILEQVYDKAPLIKNELINRQKPSGQANAAKNKLINALLTQHAHDDLGFEKDKYPPEKTIYQAIFKATGIHKKQTLQRPPKNDYNFHYVWNAIDDFLANKNTPQRLTDIYQLLEKPPHGVQSGVHSLLFIAYYLTNQRTLALYEGGVFCPNLTIELFEILNKRPELFSLESVNLTGIKAELFNGYLEKLLGTVQEDNTLLDIIKPLAKFISNLPEYTRHSKNLSAETIAVRDAFQNTQSPVKLLFETLPIACGFESYLEQQTIQNPEKFLDELVKHLNILNRHYSNLLDEFQKKLTSALKESENITLSELRAVIKQKYNLENYSTDTQGLKAFIKRLCDNQSSNKTWLESIASFLGNAPANKWRQNNQITAEYRLSDFSDRLLQLATVHSHQLDGNIAVIRLITKTGEINKVAYPIEEKQDYIEAVINGQQPHDFKSYDEKTNLAIIAAIINKMNSTSNES